VDFGRRKGRNMESLIPTFGKERKRNMKNTISAFGKRVVDDVG
jgi:hypothetical protein